MKTDFNCLKVNPNDTKTIYRFDFGFTENTDGPIKTVILVEDLVLVFVAMLLLLCMFIFVKQGTVHSEIIKF